MTEPLRSRVPKTAEAIDRRRMVKFTTAPAAGRLS
jgi:hypothetical protein